MEYDFIVKLTFALIVGMLIGIDRQLKHKPLGLKTCMILCIASCLVTIVSIDSMKYLHSVSITNNDPMRLAAQIVSGVGFLGAGVILRRGHDVISGLTSAAMIWSASGLGIAIGAGFYAEAFYTVCLLIFAVNVLPWSLRNVGFMRLNQRDIFVKITLEPNMQLSDIILHINGHEGLGVIKTLKVKDLESGIQQMELTLSSPHVRFATDIYYAIKKMNHVRDVEVEHL
ncbi:methyltransferase [Paenibacillus swuensis]|uniref:Methyltransferase n=1 Tax=Paenibacillus swuensis TaxID=1178515 RepID=A0A172TGQ7_9BACL|nr:MgtC/SapB family protein [Paenibacillus swuensis]ANE46067.1 methyltransferase [Paenibacillus swuensis]